MAQSFPWSYRSLSIIKGPNLQTIASHDENPDIPRTGAFTWVQGSGWESQILELNAISACVVRKPDGAMLFLGIDGRIAAWDDGVTIYPLDKSKDAPQNLGPLREVRNVDDFAFSVGMGRTCYRYAGQQKWTRIDDGLRAKPSEDDVGLNSIHGFSPDDLYAVGFKGEIWHRKKTTWSKISSPTNVALNKVLCAPDGKVYACGMAGMLVSGRDKSWAEIEHGATQDTFWGMCWFKDHLYLSTPNAIFRLEGTELVKLAITPKGKKKIKIVPGLSFLLLDANDTVMWSVGPKQAMFTDDGETWTETPYA